MQWTLLFLSEWVSSWSFLVPPLWEIDFACNFAVRREEGPRWKKLVGGCCPLMSLLVLVRTLTNGEELLVLVAARMIPLFCFHSSEVLIFQAQVLSGCRLHCRLSTWGWSNCCASFGGAASFLSPELSVRLPTIVWSRRFAPGLFEVFLASLGLSLSQAFYVPAVVSIHLALSSCPCRFLSFHSVPRHVSLGFHWCSLAALSRLKDF